MNKLLTFYSESHIKLYEEFFLNSFNKNLSKNFNLIVKKIPQVCESGDFASNGFDLAMLEKIKFIIENININEDQLLVFSDCDVQFFNDLEFIMDDYDILFQKDYFEKNYCAGFFVSKQNSKVLNFFEKVKNSLIESLNGKIDDQGIINTLLNNNDKLIKSGFLPDNKYWTVGNSTEGRVWNGENVYIPEDLIVHHANFTIGIENKIKLLNLVKEKNEK